jgi:hypothetical protein
MYIKAPNGEQRYKEGKSSARKITDHREIHLGGSQGGEREQLVTKPYTVRLLYLPLRYDTI